MIVVGQQIEMVKIQNEIEESLGLSFSEITLLEHVNYARGY